MKNRNYKNCIEACLVCFMACEECVDCCIGSDREKCLRLCMDCAEICQLCARLMDRNSSVSEKIYALCAENVPICAVGLIRVRKRSDLDF